MSRTKNDTTEAAITLDELKEEVLRDYELCVTSREASLIGRKEVLGGKAKFGIFGDGKELAQVCMAKQFRNGDWRSGYYRDMTFMFAIGELTVQQWFAQLYAHANLAHEPATAGRSMNGHFATRSLTNAANGRTSPSSTTAARTSAPRPARCRDCSDWPRPARCSARILPCTPTRT